MGFCSNCGTGLPGGTVYCPTCRQPSASATGWSGVVPVDTAPPVGGPPSGTPTGWGPPGAPPAWGPAGATPYGSPGPAPYGSPGPAPYGSPGPAAYGSPGAAAYGSPGAAAYGSPGAAAYGSPGAAAYGSPGSAPYGPPGPGGWPPPPVPVRSRIPLFVGLGLAAFLVVALVIVFTGGGPGEARVDGRESVSGSVASGETVTHVVTVPAGSSVRIRVEPDPDFDVTLTVYDGSGSPERVDPGYSGDAETYEVDNSSNSSRTVSIEVGGFSSASGDYEVTLQSR